MTAKKEEGALLERTYTIPLRPAFRFAPRYKKTKKAVKAVRLFLEKHMKAREVKLGQYLNEFLWKNGIKNPPPRVTVTAVKDAEGIVRAELEGKTYKESVKPIIKEEEPETLKEKMEQAIGGKKKTETEAKPAEEKSSEEKSAEEKPAQEEKELEKGPAKTTKKAEAEHRATAEKDATADKEQGQEQGPEKLERAQKKVLEMKGERKTSATQSEKEPEKKAEPGEKSAGQTPAEKREEKRKES